MLWAMSKQIVLPAGNLQITWERPGKVQSFPPLFNRVDSRLELTSASVLKCRSSREGVGVSDTSEEAGGV